MRFATLGPRFLNSQLDHPEPMDDDTDEPEPIRTPISVCEDMLHSGLDVFVTMSIRSPPLALKMKSPSKESYAAALPTLPQRLTLLLAPAPLLWPAVAKAAAASEYAFEFTVADTSTVLFRSPHRVTVDPPASTHRTNRVSTQQETGRTGGRVLPVPSFDVDVDAGFNTIVPAPERFK